MSTSPSVPKPTEAELAILNVLWQRGEATVRDVHEALYGSEGGYTTALKLLQVMHAKGLVDRDSSQRAHVYRSAVSQQSAQRRALRDMLKGLFNGRPAELVLRALGDAEAPSTEELEEIRALIDRIEQGQRHD
ncbi:MAG: BlaI/MecI/CopY family transcriptional regulator [Xanthomonadales bacterium]|nr:BlaI/MecI/CopY family transcriptional regulator [Xanthomonadales bacterium]